MKYRVEYDFMLLGAESDGKWHHTYLDNNGEGFAFDEAEQMACQLKSNSIQKIHWIEIIPFTVKEEN